MKKTLRTLAATALVGLSLSSASATPASALTGSTVENTNVRAYAVSSCAAGWINATVYITPKRQTSFNFVNAGLYDGNYGSSYYKKLMGAGDAVTFVGSRYAGMSFSRTWSQSAPRGGNQVVFFIGTDGASILPVKVTCNT